MRMKVKVGIIGCGGIARGRHIPAYLANPHTQLAALYDPVPGRAAQLAADCHAAVYEDLEQMLCHPGLDAVSICTPEQYHHDIAIELDLRCAAGSMSYAKNPWL